MHAEWLTTSVVDDQHVGFHERLKLPVFCALLVHDGEC